MLHKWNQMTFEWNASEVGGWEVLFQPHWEKDCSEPLWAFPQMDSNSFINLHRNYTNAIPWNIVWDMFNILEFRALGSLQTLQAATALGCGGSDRVTFTFLTFFLVSFFISFQFFAFGYSSRKKVITHTRNLSTEYFARWELMWWSRAKLRTMGEWTFCSFYFLQFSV